MQLRCGQCGSTFAVETGRGDRPIACPQCGHVVGAGGVPEGAAGAAAARDEPGGFAEMAKKDLAKKIRVVCGSCGRHLTTSRRWAGKRGKCPVCEGKLRIPVPEDHAEVDLSYLTAASAEADRLDLAGAWEEVEGEVREIEVIEERGARVRRVMLPVAAILVAVALVCVAIFAGGKKPIGQTGGAGGKGASEPAGTPPVAPVEGGAQGAQAPVEPRVKSPAEPKSACEVVGVASSVFASDGYRPARPAFVYVRVTAAIEAAAEALNFNSHGDDVTLTFSGRALRSLGLASEAHLPDEPGERAVVNVPAGQSRTLTFLFEAPEESGEGTLRIGGLAAAVRLQAGERFDGVDVTGTYVEQPPRNLRPLLRDPVMAVAQSATEHALVIGREGDVLSVSIPGAGIAGRASGGGALRNLELRCGQHSLACKLRFIDSGKRAVLYLSDEPFHQITYERQ